MSALLFVALTVYPPRHDTGSSVEPVTVGDKHTERAPVVAGELDSALNVIDRNRVNQDARNRGPVG